MIFKISKIIIVLQLLISTIILGQTQRQSLPYRLGGGLSVVSENDNVEGGNGFNAFIDYPLQESMTIKTSIGKYSSDTKVDILSEGDYSLLWIEGSLLFSGTKFKILPYGGGGGGYYIFTHDISSNVKNALMQLGLRAEEEIQNTFGIHIRGGANIELSPTLQLNADAKYVFLKPKLDAKVTELSTFTSVTDDYDLELNTLIISIGLIVKF